LAPSTTNGIPLCKEYNSLSHTKWDCKYHLVFISKRRKKIIYGQVRQSLGDIFHALALARSFGRQRNFTGKSFWSRGYFVSTVGLDEAIVRAYIQNQEADDERYEQMKFRI